MSTDVVALTREMPSVWGLLASLMAGGPELTSLSRGEGAVIQLSDEEGRPLVSVEAPMLIHAPGEVARLLGAEAGAVQRPVRPAAGKDRDAEGTDGAGLDAPDAGGRHAGKQGPDGAGGADAASETEPVWWTEVRAATAARGGAELASVIASRLVAQLGGRVWPSSAAASDASTPVAGVRTTAAAAAHQPAIDVLTEKAAAVIQERSLVPMSAWLAEALQAAAANELALQIVTPRDARLTMPTRTALRGLPNRWVVRDGAGGYYDGLSGSVVRWRDGAFVAEGKPAAAFLEDIVAASHRDEHQLMLTFVTRGPAERSLLLGGALEHVVTRLTGAAPGGWGTSEPAASVWDREVMTDLARGRAPTPTWLVVVGRPEARPAIATLNVSVGTLGVDEDVTLTVGYRSGEEPDLAVLPELAEELAEEHGLVSLLAQTRKARADLTVPPHVEGPPTPRAFFLGPEGLADVDAEAAARPPLSAPPRRLGRPSRRALHYRLSDDGWPGFQELMGHLRAHGVDREEWERPTP